MLLVLFAQTATYAAEATIKSMAHSTYLCGENGLVIKTAGLLARIGDDDGYKMLSSDNELGSDNSPGFLSVQYAKSDSLSANANWFSLTFTKQTEFIALTYVNRVKKIELIGLSCQIVE
jgi:hypothetical protein